MRSKADETLVIMKVYFTQMEPKQPMHRQLVLQQLSGVEKRMWHVLKVVIGIVVA